MVTNKKGKVQSVQKSTPVTESELFLEKLCKSSFLSLWSYPRLFRNQSNGKEICDLLVVFEQNIIIFSDKNCYYKITGNPSVDWGRWFKKTIEASARQLWGAERWITSFPERLFLDNACQNRFPLIIPKEKRFYRVVVAHGTEDYAKSVGNAGLIIEPSIVGKRHYGASCQPLKVGKIDPDKGFVHVFDRTALKVVLQTVDTIQDFIDYLRSKEDFIINGKLSSAASEQDLLAVYLVNQHGEKSFSIPHPYKIAHVPDGNWINFKRSSPYRQQKKANRISYFWDELIESYNKHVLDGSLHADTSSHNVAENEKVLRILASEPRTKRRELSTSLIEFITKKAPGFRTIISTDSSTAYVFGATPTNPKLPADEWARLRYIDLIRYCVAYKNKNPAILDIIGIAVQEKNLDPNSMDLSYMDTRNWGPEQEEKARAIQKRYGFTTNMSFSGSYVTNFPSDPRLPKNPRNKPCPCGSGIKYKKCCGAPKN